MPNELSYQLHPLELDPIGQENHSTSYENSDAYSAAEIDNIFQDAISTLYQPAPRDPRKRGRYDIFSLDIVLTTEEAPQLSETQRKLFNGMLLEQERRFAKEGPATTFTEHRIRTNSAVPIATAPYRLSAQPQRLLRHKLDEMLAQGIIEESDTPWAAPVVLVPKGNDDVRVCVDYRRLNTCTIPDRYPLPRIDDLLHLAKSLPYMSSLDLQSGYWQIPVHSEDREKTGFITPFGVYHFNRMPFGLRNAPSTFQRMMDRFKISLARINLLVYLDDIIIRSSSFEQHLHDVKTVLEKLGEYNLRVNRSKCRFACTSIQYLGHLITPLGIVTDPKKTEALSNLPPPTNVKQLLSFIQACSWYRRFIPKFAEIAKPLTDLTKKNAVWTWGQAEKDAWNELRQRLITSPILKQAEESQSFIVKTDASAYAIGGVLIQGEGDQEHPIEYASRLLSAAERNYSTTEREALAIVWSLARFRGYIEGAEIVVVTDHQPLKWLLTLKTPTGRLARWALQLQSYNLYVKYEPGRANRVADFLSRPPNADIEEENYLGSVQIDLPSKTEKELREQQSRDEELKEIISALQNFEVVEVSKKWIDRGYFLHRGVLYRNTEEQEDDNARLVVPKDEVKNILHAYHDSPTAGHYGIDKTTYQISRRYYWNKMRQDIAQHVRSCQSCQRYKITNRKPEGLTNTVNQRFEVVTMDLFGPLPITTTGKRWVFIVEDTASRWVELFSLSEATAEVCAKTLLDEVFLRFGLPRRLVSDNGTQFISAVMQQLTYCLGIHHTTIPLYHAESNMVERKNRDLKTQLGILVANNHDTWDKHLPTIRFAMNSARCDSTMASAAFLTFGREMRTVQDVTDDLSLIVQSENFVAEITPRLHELAMILQAAKANTERTQDANQSNRNLHRRQHVSYQPGDRVWVQCHFLSNSAKGFASKLAPRRDGPYVILRQRGPASYEVANPDTPTSPVGVYHTSGLTPYIENAEGGSKPLRPIRRRGRPKKTGDTISSSLSGTKPGKHEDTGSSSRRLRNQRGRL